MQKVLILASNPREGGNYAKRAGLEKYTYRVVHTAKQIQGLRNGHGVEVHILPSFARSVARHAILARLQWAKNVETYYVDPDDFPVWDRESVAQADKLGPLTDRQLDVATRYDRLWSAAREKDVYLAEQAAAYDEREGSEPTNGSVAVVEKPKHATPKGPRPQRAAKPQVAADEFFGS